MAKFVWRTSNMPMTRYTYYKVPGTGATWEAPLEQWVVNHLNLSRQTLILGLSNINRQAQGRVRARSRVDTGRMRSLVMGTNDYGTDILKMSFGWEAFKPFYAPFQERGTRNGITPMLAVYTAYHQALPEVQRLIRGR
jgi:hypothetical protein